MTSVTAVLFVWAAVAALIVAGFASAWADDRPARYHVVWSPALAVLFAAMWPAFVAVLIVSFAVDACADQTC